MLTDLSIERTPGGAMSCPVLVIGGRQRPYRTAPGTAG
jgi:hypothetical protein